MIDLNADLGEGIGVEAELMPLITSASIACGGHAGNEGSMKQALLLAKRHGVRVGAHPGYRDRAHLGRRELNLPPAQVTADCSRQLSALRAVAAALEVPVVYVKPHGALYNQACRDDALAAAVVAAARPDRLAVMGLPDSALERATRAAGLTYIREGFADRRYHADGTLVPRSHPNALLDDPTEAAAQVRQLIRERGIVSVCVHGDSPGAVAFTAALRQLLWAKA